MQDEFEDLRTPAREVALHAGSDRAVERQHAKGELLELSQRKHGNVPL